MQVKNERTGYLLDLHGSVIFGLVEYWSSTYPFTISYISRNKVKLK